ncbi:phage major tail tube protein [Spartinivicinus poritis]
MGMEAMELSFTINNKLIYEIDVVNHVRKIEGTDHMQAIRELLEL